MVAYSFKREFAPAIILGRKRQTVRAHRRRHARPGETMQLFTGMRTRQCCKIIPDPVCTNIVDARLDLTALSDVAEPNNATQAETAASRVSLFLDGEEIASPFFRHAFAELDGFGDMIFAGTDVPLSPFAGMVLFWMHNHGAIDFRGVVIEWEPAS